MTYPVRSNFNTSEANSAWWTVTSPDGGVVVCSTTGYSFVHLLQARLGVTADGKWGPSTANALASAVQSSGGPAAFVTAIRADVSARSLHAGSLAAAIWLLHRQSIGDAASGPSPARLSLPPDVVPPPWSQTPPNPDVHDTGHVQCVRQVPVVTNPGAPPPSTGTSGQGSASSPGDTTPGGPPTTTDLGSLPTGISLPSPTGSSLPWIAVGVLGVVAAVGVGLAVSNVPRGRRRGVSRRRR